MDTVLKFVYDTIAKPSYPKINYLPYNDLSVIQKYFINDIIAPGDTMHPIYKKYIKASNDSIPTVMKSLKEKMGRWLRFYPSAGGMRAKDLIDRIGGISEIEKCQIKPILNYKLTPNVVLYKTGENIKNYFNLDTTKFFYAIFKNNKLVGLLFKRKYGDIVLTDCSVDYHIANYDFIKSVNKENESFFYVDMTIEKPGANYQQMINMCCLINNHIVHSFCERLKMTNETDSKLKDGQSYYLKYNSLQILDTRYLELFGKKTRLQREIEQFYSEIIK